MSILRLKAKVLLSSEDSLELEERDLGAIQGYAPEWGWRSKAFRVEEIYDIISFSPTKCLVRTYDGEKVLVIGAFEELTDKWEEKLKEINTQAMINGYYCTEDNQEGETSEEDEDE